MNPFKTAWFLLVSLPLIMIREGYDLLHDYFTKSHPKSDWLYFVAMALCILLIIVLIIVVIV